MNINSSTRALLASLFFVCLLFACETQDDGPSNPEDGLDPIDTPTESVKILVDASHGGGAWWFPQHGTYNQDQYHQGTDLANYLRESGFTVDELGRNAVLNDQTLEGYDVIIRAGGFTGYAKDELETYEKALDRGIWLLVLSDHKTHDPDGGDELAEMLGLEFSGSVIEYTAPNGALVSDVDRVAEHTITDGISAIRNIRGASALMNAETNPDIEVLGWFSDEAFVDLNFNGTKDEDEPTGMPFMGLVNHSRSKVFFMTDINKLESVPRQLVNNIRSWITD